MSTPRVSLDAVSTDRVIPSASPLSLAVMQIGDSMVTGSSPAPGGSRIELWRRARAAGVRLRLVGPVSQANAVSPTDLRPEPGDPFCAGYPGETILQLVTRLQSGGSIFSWAASRAAPDLTLTDSLGTNDAAAGASSSTMWGRFQTYFSALLQLFPNAKHAIGSVPFFVAGSSPVGGIATANAEIAALNALLSGVSSIDPRLSYIDTTSSLSAADFHTDGTHLTPAGQAKKGVREFEHMMRLFPAAALACDAVPRPPRIRTTTPMVKFTATSDKLENTVGDNGWQIQATNFLIGGCFTFATLPSALTNLLYAAPGALNYTHGFQVLYDGVSSTKALNFYSQFGGAGVVITKPIPNQTVNKPFWIFVHGDRAAGIVSLWCAMQERGSGAPWTVFCLGEVTGVAPWSAADASPKIHMGTNGDIGFIGAVANVFMSSGVVGRDAIRPELEAIVFDGSNPPNLTASIPCTEGSGTTAASNVGGQSATLTGGGWYAAGAIPRLGDDT